MGFNNDIEKEIDEAMRSGKYKVAGLDMFNILDNLKLSDNLLGHLEYTEELFFDYIKDILELNKCVPGLKEYLNAIKAGDVVDNHSLEKENSFLIGLHMQLGSETVVDKLIRYYKENKIITRDDIFDLHSTLLNGTLSDKNSSIRTKNDKFVGRIENGERIIEYFPIDYKNIDSAVLEMAKLYNLKLTGEGYDNIFIQPFLVHGLYGALQIFNDGNTRFGRVMQHILMWQLINEKTEYNFDLPPIYATRSYFPFRGEYRGLITSLVKNNDNETWNKWFEFNLRRIEDQIFKSNENIKLIKRRSKK